MANAVDSLDASRGDARRAARMSVDESNLLDASSSKVQRYIKELSSALSEPQELTVDEQLLAGVIREAGEYSFGVAAVEVYSFEDPRLVPVGIWRNTDNASTVVAPNENVPGVCLVGTLWADQNSSKSLLVGALVRRSSSLGDSSNSNEPIVAVKPTRKNGLVWRDLDTIINDPDAIHGERLKALCDSGLEKAAGVTFESNGSTGMVVYYAEEGVDSKLLSAVANETYLRRTAELIGTVLAMTESRRACVAFQHRHCGLEDCVEKKEVAITCVEEGDSVKEAADVPQHSFLSTARDTVLTYLKKFRGGGAQIPPRKPWDESLWTLVGAFSGLIVLSGLNRLFHFLSDSQYYLLMGPFGALMTLQYGLTGAPASQPRNAILGQIVAGAVSLSFTYIPDSVLPVWVRQAVGPAFAIAAMIKLGIPHPPAGAHSVIYADGKHNWGFYSLVVLCSVVSIVPATIVNNMSQKRQYPIYWGYVPDAIATRWKKCKANTSKKDTETAPTERSTASLMP